MLKKILKIISQHKIVVCIIAIVIVGGGYFGYKAVKGNKGETQYVLAAVEKGTIVSSVSGSGQVSVLEQMDVKSKVSGEVAAVYVNKGDEVKTGEAIARLDDTDFKKAVQEAETSLETTKLELEELLSPPDELTLLQAENSLTQTIESKQKAEDSLVKAYEDGFNTVVSAFSDLPDIMTNMGNILYGDTINKYQDNIASYVNMVINFDEKVNQYKDEATISYWVARTVYDENFQNYKAASRYSDNATIETLLNETYETTKKIAEAIKNADNLISFVKDTLTLRKLNVPAIISTHQSSIKTDTSKTSSILSSLLSMKTTIKSDQEAIPEAERSIQEKKLSLANLKAGADDLDVRAKKITIQQKEDALLTANQNLANCYIRAPFDGIVADVGAKKGDSASSGTVVASVITRQQIAEISLNEVDMAKVKMGQKATLSFDAIEEMTITGEVTEIDTLGTVSQGVVTYGVKIAFDTQDARIKPGMSVSVEIITDIKQDVLLVPNSAIKSQNSTQYVEVMGADNIVHSQEIEAGISNDTNTEITEGIAEGDKIVTQTVSSSSSSKTNNSSNTGRSVSSGGGSMEIMRMVR